MKTITISILLALDCLCCLSQTKSMKVAFSNCFGGNNLDVLSSIEHCVDGGFIAAGSTMSGTVNGLQSHDEIIGYDCLIVKTDEVGKAEWINLIGGKKFDFCNSIIQLKDGTFLFVGSTSSDIINEKPTYRHVGALDPSKPGYFYKDVLIGKLNRNGNLLWIKCLGGSKDDEATNIMPTKDGGFIITCNTYSTNGDIGSSISDMPLKSRMWIVKIDIDGTIKEKYLFGNDNIINAVKVLEADANSYVLFGNYNEANSSRNVWLLKFDKSGKRIKEISWGGSYNDVITDAILNRENHFIVTCNSNSIDGTVGKNKSTNRSDDAWVLEFDQSIKLISQRNFGGSANDEFLSISKTDDNGYILAGHTYSKDGDVSGVTKTKEYADPSSMPQELKGVLGAVVQSFGDAWIVKLDSRFNISWEKSVGGTSIDVARVIRPVADGFVFGGNSYSSDGDVKNHFPDENKSLGSPDFWICKLSEEKSNCPPSQRSLSEITGTFLTLLDCQKGKINTHFHVNKDDYIFITTKGENKLGSYLSANGIKRDLIVDPAGGDDVLMTLSESFKKKTSTFKFGQILGIVDTDTSGFESFSMNGDCKGVPDETFFSFQFKGEFIIYTISKKDGDLEILINEKNFLDNNGEYNFEIYKLSKEEHTNRNCFNRCPNQPPKLIGSDKYQDVNGGIWCSQCSPAYADLINDCYHCGQFGFKQFRGTTRNSNDVKIANNSGCQCVYDKSNTLVNFTNCMGSFDYGYSYSDNTKLHFIFDIGPHWLWMIKEPLSFLYMATPEVNIFSKPITK